MKKVSLSVALNAPDNFEVGKCESCPIAKKEYQETYYNMGTYMVSWGIPRWISVFKLQGRIQ